MNVKECANCLLHGWKQPENKDDLQQCKKCKLIKYCGKECQTEHWQKIHKRQCRFFADQALAKGSKHNQSTCLICLCEAKVGITELMKPTNENYFCLYTSEEWKLQMSSLLHTHPFPVSGQPGNTKEKIVLVLWRLVYKFIQCQPEIVAKFQDGFVKIIYHLQKERLKIWLIRKVYDKPVHFGFPDGDFISQDFWLTVNETINRSIPSVDSFHVWKTAGLVAIMAMAECMTRMLRTLKDPLNTLPVEFRKLLSRALDNLPKFLTVTNQVLDALVSQVIPFQDILKIICGGSLKQTCSFCSREVIIAGLSRQDIDGPVAYFDILSLGIFVCGTFHCTAKSITLQKDFLTFGATVISALGEREANRCDCCFLVSPTWDVHRCSKCCTKMYCSKTCQLEDWKTHKEICQEDVEERKVKFGKEERKEKARETRQNFKECASRSERGVEVKEACEMLDKFEFKKVKKKYN